MWVRWSHLAPDAIPLDREFASGATGTIVRQCAMR
jgi:hypothetical protein